MCYYLQQLILSLAERVMEKKQIHPTMERVYQVTKITGADLAYALDETPQIVYNWERRGISKLVLSKYPINLILISAGFLLERVRQLLKALEANQSLQLLGVEVGFLLSLIQRWGWTAITPRWVI